MSTKIGSVGNMDVHHTGNDRYEVHGPSGLAGVFSVNSDGDYMGQRVTSDKEQQQKLTDMMISHAKNNSMKKSKKEFSESIKKSINQLLKGRVDNKRVGDSLDSEALEKAIKDLRGNSDNNLQYAKKKISDRVKQHHAETFADHPTKGKNLYQLQGSVRGGDKAYAGLNQTSPDGSTKALSRVSSSDIVMRRKEGMDHGIGSDHKLAKPIHKDEHDKLKTAIQDWNSKNSEKIKNHLDFKNKAEKTISELSEKHGTKGGLGAFRKKHIDQMIDKALAPNKSELTKSLTEKLSNLFKGRMDGVDIGGSPNSKNTKTYESEFEKKEGRLTRYTPRFGVSEDEERANRVASENKPLNPKTLSRQAKQNNSFDREAFAEAKEDLDEIKAKSGPVKTEKELTSEEKSKLESQYSAKYKKDDQPHSPGSPEDSAHDVVELDHSIAEEMKDLSSEEKKEMLAHLRTLKDKNKHRSPENREAGADMQKEESPAKKLLGRELTSDEHSKLKNWYETKGKSMLSPKQKEMMSNIKREKAMKPKPSLN